jgi:hypothetical protein
MATKQLVSRAWELMGVRSHWKMSNDVMAVVEHMKDAREARQRMFSAGQMPRDAARHDGPSLPQADVPPTPGPSTPT